MLFTRFEHTRTKRWWIVLVTAAAGLLLGALSTLVVTDLYHAEARVFVNVPAPESVTDLQMGEQFALTRASSYAQTARTSSVLQPVVDDLGLEISPEQLAQQLTVTHQPNTSMITITAEDSDPEHAAVIAEQTAQSLTQVAASLEGQSSAEASPVQLHIVQRSTVPESATWPSLSLNSAAGLVVGVMSGIAIVQFAYARRPLLRDPYQGQDTEAQLMRQEGFR
ncbi:YveK family protein [Kocuria arenosa]|uniref:YveK family protein n=1 Tax=Kocuria arenosa TaxID=3071446 RepID=UPI0034D781DF